MWLRADLRHRWRSWIVLGLLAGIVFGVAAAAVAGARRTSEAVPRLIRATGSLDAGVLANSPAFDARTRAAVAALPEVDHAYPFAVPFALGVARPRELPGTLLPTTPATQRALTGVVLEGRIADPRRADEVVVNQIARDKLGLRIGSTMVVAQTVTPADLASAPPGFIPPGVTPAQLQVRATLHVVGISKALSSDADWTPSSAFWDRYNRRLASFVNMFVSLRHGEAQFPRFQADVQRVTGQSLNVERASDLNGTRKAEDVTGVEHDGLLLFALAALLGGAVLVGQALVRAVNAGAADLPTWRAIGADRRIVVRAMALPALITAVVGAVTAVVVAVAISSRFPIGVARRYDLDIGTHADWPVLAVAAVALVVTLLAAAWLTAEWRLLGRERDTGARSSVADGAARLGLPPALVVGSRLAVERGHGRRAVPVRSALVGAVVGVLGFVGCLTFRAGIDDAVSSPARSGVVWNYEAGSGTGPLTPQLIGDLVHPRSVGAAVHALWNRAVPVDGVPTPVFGIDTVKGRMPLVVLAGRPPRTATEIAFAPSTAKELHVTVGDQLTVGPARRRVRVVGTALLPATSHTDYDQSGWMTGAGLRAAFGRQDVTPEAVEDYVLVRWAQGTDVPVAERNLVSVAQHDGLYTMPATLPTAVVDLGRLRTLPLVLGIFFALLAAATVAHALVTTVRRRRHDLAVLRTIGFTRRQSRLAVAWQATLLAIAGLFIGIPLGILAGRLVWRSIADRFPIDYVAPIALVALLLAIPMALAIANALAAGPAWAAARIRPAEVLRTE
jgi:ABC-type lipoprotein release transport system permease subunit